MKSRSPKSGPRDEEKGRRGRPTANGVFPVVAIGASAGGLESYSDFFRALPRDLGMAFVLVQHLDPSHHSLLADIISKTTRMPVDEVRSGMRIRPNWVYVIPPNALMGIGDGVFMLGPRGKEPGQHHTVNFFMRSLAEERKGQAIGIVFSGTGADGTLGLQEIKAEGGITFAQEPASAKYDGMPHSAIASGCVDFVLPPKGIAKELERIHRHPYVRKGPDKDKDEAEAEAESPPRKEDFAKVIDQLRKSSGVDFSQYKPATIQRRALRRMLILKKESVNEYARYLKEHAEETEKLYDDVLIPVTTFFRDFEAFEALKKTAYPAIVKDKVNKGAIRMWAPGCSTGEETYSLAMTLLEFLGDKASSYQVQIFGTDLNEKGIHKARAGVYPESIAQEVSAERLLRFFVKVDEGYRVNKAVRDLCIFAQQNLAADPPFSQMNLVACRNLLIYLGTALQRKIVPILHYALKPSGFLILGKAEGITGFQSLFSTVDAKHKIFANKAVASRLHYDFSQPYPSSKGEDIPGKTSDLQGSTEPEVDPQVEADRLILKNYAPVGVVINANLEVVHFRGRTTPYLEPAPGKPTLNLLKLARNGLAIELRSLINLAKKKGVLARRDAIPFEENGRKRILNISVSPLGEKKSSARERHFLVLFEEVTSRGMSEPKGRGQGRTKAGADRKHELGRLKQELVDAQDALRAAMESEDALKEEFQSANEEILSANEELQSTNEELETSKEELQSANEELNTLNDELRHKNTELHDLGNALLNFINSTNLPVVMLDRTLRIRRLTPNADKLLKVAPSDIGRSISDIRLNIKMSDLELVIDEVLTSLRSVKREVQDLRDRWYSLTILPYRTVDHAIDGVVLVLQDIDEIKAAGEQMKKSSEFFYAIINTVRQPLLVLDTDLRVMSANESFLHIFQVSREQTANKFLYRIGNEQWNIPKLRMLLEQILPKDQAVVNFEVEHEFEKIGQRKMVLNARRLFQASNREPMILLAIEDMTERKRAEAALIKSEKLAVSGRLAGSLAHEINNPLQAVMNLMALLQQSQELNNQDRQYATLAAKELGRIVHLIRQSLGFYRETTPSAAEVNLEDVLESMLNLYSQQIEAKQITVTRRYRLTGTIQSYPGEIRQVFSTLLINAMDAVPQAGAIALRARNSSDWRNPAIQGVRITLVDNGSGIPADLTTHIYEPFFTTKGEQGTGLGLWTTSGIVDRLGGSIRVRSRVSPKASGTCFSVFFPDQASSTV
ncbi:MAG TPA: chemotaxis protein CheB [Candidatus Angelobacter sp.]